jgi:hypothetical protein
MDRGARLGFEYSKKVNSVKNKCFGDAIIVAGDDKEFQAAKAAERDW